MSSKKPMKFKPCRCLSCTKVYTPTSPRQKWCKECQPEQAKITNKRCYKALIEKRKYKKHTGRLREIPKESETLLVQKEKQDRANRESARLAVYGIEDRTDKLREIQHRNSHEVRLDMTLSRYAKQAREDISWLLAELQSMETHANKLTARTVQALLLFAQKFHTALHREGIYGDVCDLAKRLERQHDSHDM